MQTFRSSFLSVAFLSVVGCGTPNHAISGDHPPLDDRCGRYQERLDGRCVSATVTGIESRELEFTRDGYTLHGTLTLPRTNGPYRPPVFVLTHGSGPNDRDETAIGHLGVGYGQQIRTFRLLAEALGNAGAAVYRYDKRTCVRENSEGRCPTAFQDYPGSRYDIRVDDYIADFRAAVQAVAALPEVDGQDITVVGHSQGANFVPLLMADEPGVVAGIQLAGSALPLEELIVRQLREFADYLENLGSQFAAEIATLRALADEHETALAQIRSGTFEGTSFQNVSTAYWLRWMESLDRLEEEFIAVDGPLLLLNGDLDFNVPPYHLETFREWSTAAGKTNSEFVLLPDVTHAFITITGGTHLDANFSPRALEAILGWHRAIERR